MLNQPQPDKIEVKQFNKSASSLLIQICGQDRAGIVAQVSAQLEGHRLYIGAIAFNLVLPGQDEYDMQILAKGNLSDLEKVSDLIKSDTFLPPRQSFEISNIFWPTSYMLHLALNTPDREGLIAKISNIVGQHRSTISGSENGSFVHLIGNTDNSGGPEGGTAYFRVRANIASQTLAIQKQIEQDLLQWATDDGIHGDLWLRDLNPEA